MHPLHNAAQYQFSHAFSAKWKTSTFVMQIRNSMHLVQQRDNNMNVKSQDYHAFPAVSRGTIHFMQFYEHCISHMQYLSTQVQCIPYNM